MDEVLYHFGHAGNRQLVEEITDLEVPTLTVIRVRIRHLAIHLVPFAARLEWAAKVGEIQTPGVVPVAVEPFAVERRSANLQSPKVGIKREGIEADSGTVALAVSL